MSDGQPRICIVDDDDFYSEILSELLQKQQYQTTHFQDPMQALTHFQNEISAGHYDALLLDVVMPDMDGYELCRQCREIPSLNNTPVLFVSSQTSLEDQIKGYESGGDDFLTKPVQAEMLAAKLSRAIKSLKTNKDLEDVASQARVMMNQAISSAGEMDIVAQFVNNSLSCTTTQALAHTLLNACHLLGVQCSTYIRSQCEPVFESIDGTRKAIEMELLEMANKREGAIDFNGRLIINLPELSLLVRRLPDDDLKCERLKEQLSLLASVAANRVSAVDKEHKVQTHEKVLTEILESAQSAVQDLVANTSQQEQVISDVTDEFLMTLREDLLDLALDKDQEQILMTMVRKNISKITDMLMENKKQIEQINEPFKAFISSLNQAL